LTSASGGASGSKKKKSGAKEKAPVKMEEDVPPPSPASGSFLDVPIFRDEFLEHNKSREAELKQLRKQVKTSR
jgi:hypothetical protein